MKLNEERTTLSAYTIVLGEDVLPHFRHMPKNLHECRILIFIALVIRGCLQATKIRDPALHYTIESQSLPPTST